jgi:hypothetical protein
LDRRSFDITGFDGVNHIATSSASYAVTLRVGNQTAEIEYGDPVELSGVTLWLYPRLLSPNSIGLLFTLYKRNSTEQIVDIAVGSDVRYHGDEWAPVWSLPNRRGLVISTASTPYVFSWALRDFPLVSDVTTDWYGVWYNLTTGIWSQVELENLTDVDSAFAFSWQNISLPPAGWCQIRLS